MGEKLKANLPGIIITCFLNGILMLMVLRIMSREEAAAAQYEKIVEMESQMVTTDYVDDGDEDVIKIFQEFKEDHNETHQALNENVFRWIENVNETLNEIQETQKDILLKLPK